MVNTPIPHSLKSEAKKAAKILKEFTVPTAKMGPDKLIPAGILVKAKGLAILTVVKVGFLVTARGGSGIVIAKLEDGLNSEWSAPAAIGIAGLGGGFELGAEVTDFVIILNKRSAVTAFSKGGNLTLGGNFTVAAGPLGRNLEADVALRSAATIYTYSKTRGLFAGVSVEGSALIERKDANKKFYERDIRTYEILRGDVEPPPECACLYEVLESHKRQAEKQLVRLAEKKAMKVVEGEAPGLASKISGFKGAFKSGRKKSKAKQHESSPKQDWDSDSPDSSPQVGRTVSKVTRTTRHTVSKTTRSGNMKSSGGDDSFVSSTSASMLGSSPRVVGRRGGKSPQASAGAGMSSAGAGMSSAGAGMSSASGGAYSGSPRVVGRRGGKVSSAAPARPRPASGISHTSTTSSDDSIEMTATALYTYKAQLPCDLSFKKGDRIALLTLTQHEEDWWEGWCHGKTGIFPSNYVRINS